MIFISILILIVAIALPSFNKQVSPILFTRISSIIFLYAGALNFNALYIQSIGSGIGIYSGLFHVTIISQFLEVFLLIIGSLILISWHPNAHAACLSAAVRRGQPDGAQYNKQASGAGGITLNYAAYSLVVLFSTLGASLLVSSYDLISMYLSIELQSFGVYILATLYRNSESATSAGLKYFLLGGLSSCIILLGASLIYTYTGLTNFESIYSLISVWNSASAPYGSGHTGFSDIITGLSLGLILVIIGFLFKIAAAPLHYWAPDVYDDSPTIVTIWLTIMPKISILVLLLEMIGNISPLNIVYGFAGVENIGTIKILLLISSLLSLIIGTVVGLAQTKIKRLLAYSTISHVGFILLALVINTEQSAESLIFYIIQYSLTNLNTFLIIIALGYIGVLRTAAVSQSASAGRHTPHLLKNNADINYITELKGQFFSNPVLSLSLSVCLFSMAGIPPLIGFFAKQFVLYSAIQNGYYFISIIAIIVSVISASYYLKIIKVLHTAGESHNEEASAAVLNASQRRTAILNSNVHSFSISTLTLTIILFVLKPSIILNSTQLLSLYLYNF